jgi:hypothetical protein
MVVQAGFLRLEETLDHLFAKGNSTVMVLLDYGLGMENLETALPFIVFDVERALTRVEHIPLLLQNSSRFLHCKREKN